ncbi:MAG: ribonuclease HII [Rhodospirillaceae bacterium]|nr:ribonuclease HII [Rhodospirillaceae bacterium]|tara:strand:+ start:43 stop:720 length:678 start_codon:yes stop_codon:yes gene_type:complete
MVRYVTAAPDKPDYTLEQPFCKQGAVIGVDEAGRGPWAGPVTATAFWINPEFKNMLPRDLTDSKKLPALKREKIRQGLCASNSGHLWATRHSSVVEIDRKGILPATFSAMVDAVSALADLLAQQYNMQLSMVLIDGNLLPPLDVPCKAVVRGDSRSLSIAAASVLAKEARDEVMRGLATTYPDYGWQTNAGYGTKRHQDALQQFGVTPHHRKSFAPIKNRMKIDT